MYVSVFLKTTLPRPVFYEYFDFFPLENHVFFGPRQIQAFNANAFKT